MHRQKRVNDSVHWYMGELSARVVAESGRACDRFHLGKLILRGLKDAPEFTLQIDGATGQSETNASVLERSVKCAIAMKNSGLCEGDVIALLAPNHLDISIVYYAALYLGIVFAAVDRNVKDEELRRILECDKPKLIFCQASKLGDIEDALGNVNLEAGIVTFAESTDRSRKHCTFPEFLHKYENDKLVDEFKPTDFDPETTIASIIATSGTTGATKQAIISHKNFAITGPHLWSRFTTFPTPTSLVLIAAPIQWMSSMVNFNFSPILRYTRLQSSEPPTLQNVCRLINSYQPTFLATSTSMMSNLVKHRDQCDLSSFELIVFGGSSGPEGLIEEIKKVMPRAEVCEAYGFTEASTYFALQVGSSPPGSCGVPTRYLQYRLINVETQEDVAESMKPGELWVKGPGVTKGYYNNAKATQEALTENGWFKTGDILYRDENWNFYFVDRIKLLIRYRDYLISPTEVENTIRQQPGVFDVAVTEIPDYECTSLPVACVIRRPGSYVSAQEIKDLVKEKLDDWKQLRGGVLFLKELPLTATTKIDRKKLKETVLKETRE